jgi:hypothetical protein
MAKVYPKHEGGEVQIGNLGIATSDRPVVVSEEIGRELATCDAVRVETDEPAPASRAPRLAPPKAWTPPAPAVTESAPDQGEKE